MLRCQHEGVDYSVLVLRKPVQVFLLGKPFAGRPTQIYFRSNQLTQQLVAQRIVDAGKELFNLRLFARSPITFENIADSVDLISPPAEVRHCSVSHFSRMIWSLRSTLRKLSPR